MKIKIYTTGNKESILLQNSKDPISFNEDGYIELDEFSPDECWHLCNWSCWTDKKPDNLYSDLEVVSSGVVFLNPITEEYFSALPVGWFKGKSLREVEKCIRDIQNGNMGIV